MSKMKLDLIVDPPSELHFKPPFTDIVTSYIILINPTKRDICFNVKTTAPKSYCVRPNRGTIQPSKTVSIAVMLQPIDLENGNKNWHKFMVQCIFAPEGKYSFDDLWNNTPADNFTNFKLQCVFDIPTESSQANNNEPVKVARDRREDEKETCKVKDPIQLQGFGRLSLNFQDALLDEEDSDVTFYVGDQKYPAHKVIIKTISPVFRAMLKNDIKEKSESVINIPDCDPLIFRDFLTIMYTGKLDDISNRNVFELYHISDKYYVKDLKTKCVDFMINNLSVDIICDVISLATRYCEKTLLSSAIEFFTNHAEDIVLTVSWKNFVAEHMMEANEFLKILNEI